MQSNSDHERTAGREAVRFSIIIPAYNAEKRLAAAIDSVKIQTCTDYELIVVCDSCEDNTAELARACGADKVIEVKNHNDGLSRNSGIEAAVGEYILFMDDDDHWIHRFQLEALDRKIDMWGEPDMIAMGFYWEGFGYRGPLDNNGHRWPNVWSKCWRRDAIGDIRFPNVYSVSDLEFCKLMDERFIRNEMCVRHWDTPWYYYNWNRPGSISATGGATWLDNSQSNSTTAKNGSEQER